ncbi:MAG: nitroreductase family deazaflavin-dependent oxidoreductase [Halioglobus sp.]|nr:nitroreductase family deazaflavin-dependent oxidoreductase [Halioglobus sp.]
MELLRTDIVRQALSSRLATRLLKKTIPPLDKTLLRMSRGWINTGMQPVVLLRTHGAKSGLSRDIATLCMPVGRDLVLVGSNWGQEYDPAWVLNLRTTPEACVTFRGYVGRVHARELSGRERSVMWQRLTRFNPQYERYQDLCSRRLPVILLERPV